jgi:hypothetical protein
MSLDISLVLSLAQIVIQFIAAYFSYKIYLFNRGNYGWISVTIALVLMSFRRITVLVLGFNYMPAFSGLISSLDKLVLPSLISILLFIGLWSMLKDFERFEILKSKVKFKLKKKNG